MLVLGVTAAALLLIGFTRVGVRVTRPAGGSARAMLRLGPLRLNLFKLLKREEKTGPPKEKKPGKEKRISPREIPEILKAVRPLLGAAVRAVRIDRLYFALTLGSGDPCDDALLYGRLHTAWGALRPALREVMRVKKEDVRLTLDFQSKERVWSTDVSVTISVGRALGIGGTALYSVWKVLRKQKADGSAVASTTGG